MLEAYREHVKERAREGIDPKPLNAEQVNQLVELLKNPPESETDTLLDLLENRIPAGVDDAAYVKAAFLNDVANDRTKCSILSREKATELLGTMLGGYNIAPLVDLLDDAELGALIFALVVVGGCPVSTSLFTCFAAITSASLL